MTAPEDFPIRSAEMWLKHPDFKGIQVLDPDGWDRHGDFSKSWSEPITRYEFEVRLGLSTCAYPAGYFKVGRDTR